MKKESPAIFRTSPANLRLKPFIIGPFQYLEKFKRRQLLATLFLPFNLENRTKSTSKGEPVVNELNDIVVAGHREI